MSTKLWSNRGETLLVTQAGDGRGLTRVEVCGRSGQVQIRNPDEADEVGDALRLWARNERAMRATQSSIAD